MSSMNDYSAELQYIAGRCGFSEVDLEFSSGLNQVLFRATDRFGKPRFFTLSLSQQVRADSSFSDERKIDLLSGCIKSLSQVNWTDDPLTVLESGLKHAGLSIDSVAVGNALCLIVDCADLYGGPNPICSITVWDVKDSLALNKRRMEAEFELMLIEAGYSTVSFPDDSEGGTLTITISEDGGVQLTVTCSVIGRGTFSLPYLGRCVTAPNLKDATRAVLEALIDMDWDEPIDTLIKCLTKRTEDYAPVVKYGVSTYSFTFRLNGYFEGSIKLNEKAYAIVEERVVLAEERKRQKIKDAIVRRHLTALRILRYQEGKADIDFDTMDGHEFEAFCANLLEHNGYENVTVTKGSGDQGIDIIAERDGVRYGIQCKRYNREVGNAAVREAYAGKTFYGCHVAVVISNNVFTGAAIEAAEGLGVVLWDRAKLESLVCSANVDEDA